MFSINHPSLPCRLSKISCLILLLASKAFSNTWTLDFSNSQYKASDTTVVWNLASRSLHLPRIIDRTAAGDTDVDDTVDIGSGVDGAFSTSTYSNFDTDSSDGTSIITLDTSRTYEFTQFSLDTGYTLTATGDSPLTIKVQGDFEVKGTINLSGSAGGTISSDTSSVAAGGSACCGGGSGGNGGSTSTSAANGTAVDTLGNGSGKGGSPSVAAGNGSGGGGGGAYSLAGTAGATPAGGGSGGTGGTLYGDEYLSTQFGGSGGGGGAAYTLGAGLSSGGGGGGGGGCLTVSAGGYVSITPTGQILAKGGNGGSTSNGALLGGSGGSGAGGSIRLYAGNQYLNNGVIDARAGTGGTGSGGGNGGDGATGRNRFVDSTANWGLNSSPITEEPAPQTAELGRVYYSTESGLVAETTSIDLGNSAPNYNGITPTDSTPTGTSITYEFAGSSDDFATDDTGYVSRANINRLNGKRYFKIRVTLSTSNRSVSPTVSKIILDYSEHQMEDFSFALSSCSPHAPTNPGPESLLSFFFVMLIPLIIFGRSIRRIRKVTQSES